ncbi:hypothetical protein FNV43_RR12224 [Rhamnella rubrinervis]|uniref:Uncharacterized protein n=1 Tax=Rhamnella rubrinervis TaxID=2594499 RepID=A0A8K0H7S6_9ROSA|nr:hypothetical protein FNV43_RR12224 [Rhamnella rubrinervis]
MCQNTSDRRIPVQPINFENHQPVELGRSLSCRDRIDLPFRNCVLRLKGSNRSNGWRRVGPEAHGAAEMETTKKVFQVESWKPRDDIKDSAAAFQTRQTPLKRIMSSTVFSGSTPIVGYGAHPGLKLTKKKRICSFCTTTGFFGPENASVVVADVIAIQYEHN